jgi:predicted DNA-binding transcriptional regulator YafY
VRTRRRRAPATPPEEGSLRSAVETLRSGDRTTPAQPTPAGAATSSTDTLAVLSQSALEDRRVWIGVVDSAGVASQRVLQPTHVGSGVLAGRDVEEARERRYPLHRITSATLVEP